MEEQDKQVESKPARNELGQLLPGNTANPAGRPKGKTLKEYAREYFMLKTDDEKKVYIENLEEKLPGFAWKMGEGNPHNTEDITSKGEKIVPIYGGQSIQGHHSDQKDIQPEKKD